MKVAKNAHTSVHARTLRNVVPNPLLPKANSLRKFSSPTQVNRFVGD